MKAKYYIHRIDIAGPDSVTIEYCHQMEWDYFEETGWENFDMKVKTIAIDDLALFMRENQLNVFDDEDGYPYEVNAEDYFRTTLWDEKCNILSKYLNDGK